MATPRHSGGRRRAPTATGRTPVTRAGGTSTGAPAPSMSRPENTRERAPSAVPAQDVDAPRRSFPDLPRLELDQLLTQLVERAQEVMATQGRLRGLLRASHIVAGDLD